MDMMTHTSCVPCTMIPSNFPSFSSFAEHIQSLVTDLGIVEPYSSEQCMVISKPDMVDMARQKLSDFQTFPINSNRFYVLCGNA